MALKVKIDDTDFRRALNEFQKVSGKSFKQVLLQEAKLVTRNCMSMTPPTDKKTFYANSKGKVAWAAQKKIGLGAMLNDTLGKAKSRQNKKTSSTGFKRGKGDGGIFKVAGSQTFKRAEQLNRDLGYDWAGMKHALWMTKTGRVFGVEKNMYNPDASVGLMKRHHDKYRGKNGRVSRAGSKTLNIGRHVFLDKMVVSIKAWNTYYKHLNTVLGRAKAGWLAAANKFKFKGVAKWVKQHGQGEGSVRDNSSHKLLPFVVIENRVPYLKRHDNDLSIVKKAMQGQVSNLKKKAEQAMKSAARKSKLKSN